MACFYMAHELKLVFYIFVCKGLQKQRIMCAGYCMWPEKPKIFTLWPFTEKSCQLLIGNTAWHMAGRSGSIYELHFCDCSFSLPPLTLFGVSSHPGWPLSLRTAPSPWRDPRSHVCAPTLCRKVGQGHSWVAVDAWARLSRSCSRLEAGIQAEELKLPLSQWMSPDCVPTKAVYREKRTDWTGQVKRAPEGKSWNTHAEPWDAPHECLTHAASTLHAWQGNENERSKCNGPRDPSGCFSHLECVYLGSWDRRYNSLTPQIRPFHGQSNV